MITGDMEYEDLVGLTEILGWKNITTKRQKKNGTTIYRLPIKKYGQYIEVGSFESGYVRRINGGYTPYQINKTENYDHFYKAYEWTSEKQRFTGKYNKHVCKKRILIEDEEDRLEYLIAFCLKNYYINQANEIENGNYIPKWKHEYEMKNGSIDKVKELQKDIQDLKYESIMNKDRYEEMERQWKGSQGALQNLSVIVNNERYKII